MQDIDGYQDTDLPFVDDALEGPTEIEGMDYFPGNTEGHWLPDTVREMSPEEIAVSAVRAGIKKEILPPKGTLMVFDSVSDRGQHYTYAAIFVDGNWYLTGNGNFIPRDMTNADLMARLSSSTKRITNIKVAMTFDRIEN